MTLARTGWIFTIGYARKLSRSPALLINAAVQPILFVLLFAFVLGGAIRAPGSDYAQYFLPGILVQTAVFIGAGTTASGLAEEMRRGVIDRYRTMPIGVAGLLLGRTMSDLLQVIWATGIVVLIGRVAGLGMSSLGGLLVGLALLLATGAAFSWAGAFLALVLRGSEGVAVTALVVLFPLTFASSAYVEPGTMPVGLRTFAEYNPVSVVADAVRSAWGMPVEGSPATAVLWLVGIGAAAALAAFRLMSRR